MKRLLTLLIIVSNINLIYTQNCIPYSNEKLLIYNNKFVMSENNSLYGSHYIIRYDSIYGNLSNHINPALLFAQSINVAAIDKDDKFYFAGSTYKSLVNNNDFYPGPIVDGIPTLDCDYWSGVFSVSYSDVMKAVQLLYNSDGTINSIDCELIPETIREWPGRNNPNLELPVDEDLALFYDYDSDGNYNPCNGDLPHFYSDKLNLSSIGDYLATIPHRITLSIQNDVGPHLLSKGEPLNIELHSYNFSYLDNPDVDNTVFTRDIIHNKGNTVFNRFKVSIWTDVDLGCPFDDLFGNYKDESMAFFFNEDEIDGDNGEFCGGGSPTFGDNTPTLAISYHNGLNNTGSSSEISSKSIFTFNCGDNSVSPFCDLDSFTIDARRRYFDEYILYKGDTVNHYFNGNPIDTNTTRVCNNLSNVDVRNNLISDEIELLPNESADVIYSMIIDWSDYEYPCPDINPLIYRKQQVDEFITNDFKVIEKIPSPSLTFDRGYDAIEVQLNNIPLDYEKTDPNINDQDDLYRFEGVLVYQVKDEFTTLAALEDPQLSVLVHQSDISNEVSDVVNWQCAHYIDSTVVCQEYQNISGTNDGLKSSFIFDYDILNDKPIDRNLPYHFVVLSYSYNNYKDINLDSGEGQAMQFRTSYASAQVTTVAPDNDNYDLTAEITRISGVGNGNSLKVSPEFYEQIFKPDFDHTIDYVKNHGPFDIIVVDENKIDQNTAYRLEVVGPFNSSSRVCSFDFLQTFIKITNLSTGESWSSNNSIEMCDHLFEELGLIVSLHSTQHPFEKGHFQEGIFGVANDSSSLFRDDLFEIPSGVSIQEPSAKNVSNLRSGKMGYKYLYPALFYKGASTQYGYNDISPFKWNELRLANRLGTSLPKHFNNIDLVLTPDKDKWSRCIVVEGATPIYEDSFDLDIDGLYNFKPKWNPSIDKSGKPDGTGFGFSWFPGYAVDVETGQRLNLFFAENTYLSEYGNMKDPFICDDMIWNPSDELITGDSSLLRNIILGGQHYVYITRTPYDECQSIYERARSNASSFKYDVAGSISYIFTPVLEKGKSLLSIDQGLLSDETIFSPRKTTPFSSANTFNHIDSLTRCSMGSGHPSYEFKIIENNARSNTTTSNRSIPWKVVNQVNLFSVENIHTEEITIRLINKYGTPIHEVDLIPDQSVDLSSLLASYSGLFYAIIYDKDKVARKSYKIISIR